MPTPILVASNYIASGFQPIPAVNDWRAGVVDALTQYTVNGGSWDDVKTAFVDGWATQYAKEKRLSWRRSVVTQESGRAYRPPPIFYLRRTELLAGMDRARAPGAARKKHR